MIAPDTSEDFQWHGYIMRMGSQIKSWVFAMFSTFLLSAVIVVSIGCRIVAAHTETIQRELSRAQRDMEALKAERCLTWSL